MTVMKYDWGRLSGGSSGGDTPVVPSDSLYGPPEQFSGSLGVGDTTLTFSAPTKSVQVINQDDSDGFSISFDGGTTWIAVGSYGQVRENVSVNSIILRSTVADVDYAVVAVLTA